MLTSRIEIKEILFSALLKWLEIPNETNILERTINISQGNLMGSLENLLTYIFAICVVCSYCLFFGHLFILCFSSIFCLKCFNDSQPKHSEENCYITLKNQGNDCVVSIDDCGISSKHIVKASIEANTRILL